MKIINVFTPNGNSYQLELCDTFGKKLLGLMFRKSLPEKHGLLFEYTNESIINTSIHMFFMNFPITVVWVNQQNIVVDKKIALVWHPYYASGTPASKVIETGVSSFDDFVIGEQLSLAYEK